jgi:RimJ/RimL family protein N-acetyltransferase
MASSFRTGEDSAMGNRITPGEVALRPWTTEDADALAELFDEELVYRFTPVEPPFTSESAANRISLLTAAEQGCRSYSRAVIVGGSLVGELSAYGRRPVPDGRVMDVSWVIGAEHRGRGIATASLRRFMAELQPAWEVDQFVADISPENVASQHVASACGFTPDDTEPVRREGREYSVVPWRLRFT